jgi:tetratricopeptide (TPR) repeat protein
MGVGAGNWQFNYTKYSISDVDNIVYNNISFQKPHNDFLWVFSELGIIGFSLLLFVMVLIAIKGIKILKESNSPKVKLILSFFIGFLIISFFSFPKERIGHIILIMGGIALLLIEQKADKSQSVYLKKGLPILLIIMLGFNLMFSFYRLKGQYYTTLLLQAKSKGRTKSIIKYGKKAKSILYKTDILSKPIDTYLGSAYHERNKVNKVRESSEMAYEIAPYDFEVLTNYGIVLLKTKDNVKAKSILNKSYEINRFYEPTLVNLAIIYFNEDDVLKAQKYLMLIDDYELKYPQIVMAITQKIG